MEMLLVSLVMLVIGTIVGIVNTQKANKIKRAEALLSSCSLEGKTLHIKEQNKLFATVMKIKNHEVAQYQNDPLKVHVGAATVGGVTTGGVYTTGGGLSQTDYNDGRSVLIYKQVVKPKENEVHLTTFISETELKSIVLSDELARKAKQSEIKEYLKGNTIEIVQEVKPSNIVAELMSMGQNLRAANQLSMEQAAGYPSRKKCEKIIAWLCEE